MCENRAGGFLESGGAVAPGNSSAFVDDVVLAAMMPVVQNYCDWLTGEVRKSEKMTSVQSLCYIVRLQPPPTYLQQPDICGRATGTEQAPVIHGQSSASTT